ncbi:MAG: arsenate reductase ArsC [Planctomycetota bacterium]
MLPKLNVLFLCTGNSCRSQMGEGWARSLHGDAINAYSAGLIAKGLKPHAVAVMREAGVDITGQRSQTLDEVMAELGDNPGDEKIDVVITVCGHAHETCPVFPGGATIIHRGFDDPPALAENEPDPEVAIGHYRRVRDEIRDYVQNLPQVLSERRVARAT